MIANYLHILTFSRHGQRANLRPLAHAPKKLQLITFGPFIRVPGPGCPAKDNPPARLDPPSAPNDLPSLIVSDPSKDSAAAKRLMSSVMSSCCGFNSNPFANHSSVAGPSGSQITFDVFQSPLVYEVSRLPWEFVVASSFNIQPT